MLTQINVQIYSRKIVRTYIYIFDVSRLFCTFLYILYILTVSLISAIRAARVLNVVGWEKERKREISLATDSRYFPYRQIERRVEILDAFP